MKKQLISVLCCVLLFLSGCTAEPQALKYRRVSLSNDELGESLSSFIGKDTSVINTVNQDFPAQLPIYQISPRQISQLEFQQMQQQLGIADNPSHSRDHFELDGNMVFCNLTSYTDFDRGYFDMREDELEILAWEMFEKIPFMDGNYEYLGIQSKMTVNDASGDHVSRVGVSFRRLLDDIRVVGQDNCMLYFDGSGLVSLQITLFDYQQIGTMDVLPIKTAASQIKTPDAFILENQTTLPITNRVESLEVDRTVLLWVNQHSDGCDILQPVYNFIGTATDTNGNQAEFSSRIIAIPDSYTYESE